MSSQRTLACFLLLGSLGCSPGAPDAEPGGSTPAATETEGCSVAPACGTCGTCLDRCYCQKQDTAICAVECATIGTPTNPMPSANPTPSATTMPSASPTPSATTMPSANPTPSATTMPSAEPTAPPPIEPPPPTYRTVTVSSARFDIPPGGEVFRCQNFKNPVGQDIAIVESESFMAPGSHHLFLFREPTVVADSGGVEACSGVELRDYVHLAQMPHVKWTYPPGVARLLRANDGLRIAAHYLNTSDQTITGQITVTLAYDDPGAFQLLAAPLFLNQALLSVPPGRSVATRDFLVPYDIRLLRAVGHMHSRGVLLDVRTTAGQPIYDSTTWSEPEERVYEPPLDIPGGSTIRWSCTYENPTATTFSFGESAGINEMCIMYGLFHPTAPGINQGVTLGGVL